MVILGNDLKIQSEKQQGLIFSNLSSYQTDATQKDFLLPFKDLQTRAATGDCSAQVLVGLSLKYGWYGCVINKEEGNKWIGSAKKQDKNSPAKLCAEGLCCEEGIGSVIVKNPEKAMECYTLAIKQGYVPALWCLADMLDTEVSNKNKEINEQYRFQDISIKLLKDKANSEKIESSRQLATQGSAQGFSPCLAKLARCYAEGYGIKQDYKEAMRLAKMAAQAGVAHAKNIVGVLYYDGLGVTSDRTEGRKWYKASADQGYETAKENLADTQCCCVVM